MLRKLKECLSEAKTESKTIVITGCRLILPPELEREITILEFALPGKQELAAVLQGIGESANIQELTAEQESTLLDAATGLTTIEAENAYALSVAETGGLRPEVVSREKRKR